jgi:hypothetical protein
MICWSPCHVRHLTDDKPIRILHKTFRINQPNYFSAYPPPASQKMNQTIGNRVLVVIARQ